MVRTVNSKIKTHIWLTLFGFGNGKRSSAPEQPVYLGPGPNRVQTGSKHVTKMPTRHHQWSADAERYPGNGRPRPFFNLDRMRIKPGADSLIKQPKSSSDGPSQWKCFCNVTIWWLMIKYLPYLAQLAIELTSLCVLMVTSWNTI